jgi:hypothetical protein
MPILHPSVAVFSLDLHPSVRLRMRRRQRGSDSLRTPALRLKKLRLFLKINF